MQYGSPVYILESLGPNLFTRWSLIDRRSQGTGMTNMAHKPGVKEALPDLDAKRPEVYDKHHIYYEIFN